MSWFRVVVSPVSRWSGCLRGKKTNNTKDMRVFRDTWWPRYNRKKEWGRSPETWKAWLRICSANGHEGMAQSCVSRHKMKHGTYLFCTRGLITAVMRHQGWYAQPQQQPTLSGNESGEQNMRDGLGDVIKDEWRKNNEGNTFDSSQGSTQTEPRQTECMLHLTKNKHLSKCNKTVEPE